MIRTIVVLTFIASFAPVPVWAPEASDGFFKKGDRVVFLGDSITEQYQYSSYIELYLTTRFPAGHMSFVNAGIGGDTANGGAGRFQNHVLAEKPTAVTINFGMNDGGYGKFNPQGNKTYVERTSAMLAMAKKANVRVALISPNAVDRRVQERFKLYLETQKQFYAPLQNLAKQHDAAFVDQYAVTRGALERMEKDDVEATKVRPFADGFHTASPGGLLMAHAILVGLKEPALVSDVIIESGVTEAKTQNCKVEDVRFSKQDNRVSFSRLDDALPLPVQKEWLSILPYVNNLSDLNQYGLTVKGLARDAKYKLKIDKKDVAAFTGEQLAQGVNVGNVMAGPIYDQSQKVFQAINTKNQLVAARFAVMRFTAPDWLADFVKENRPLELLKRADRIQEMQAEIYKLAKPVGHQWELTPAP